MTEMGKWWFIRVRSEGFFSPHLDRKRVRKAGRIREDGMGTVADPDAYWYVVRSKCQNIAQLRKRLGPLSDRVTLIEELRHPEEAATFVRQLELIG